MTELYAGYFDESGTNPESKAVCVAGFISNVPRWDAFSLEWEKALIDFGLMEYPGYFHMTDFESPLSAPYNKWSRELRQTRLNTLLEIIKKHTLGSVGCLVPKALFDSVMSPFAKAFCGGAYGLAATVCARLLLPTLIGVDGWMEYSFEDGAEGRGELLTFYDKQKAYGRANMRNLRMVGLAFRDKRVYLPLQAADILAYELFREFPRSQGLQERRSVRYPLASLHEPPFSQWHYLDEERLRQLNAELSNPREI
ncbi:MAG: DUF3800 domain-containing protein [Chloroflexi bacterium]|nr:DUF3800 domain-containing protein [Chloroflexota bacterium]